MLSAPLFVSSQCDEETSVNKKSGGQEQVWKTRKRSGGSAGRVDGKAGQNLQEDPADSGVLVHSSPVELH